MATYEPPLDQLLTLGAADAFDWADYAAMGITPEHVSGLLAMLDDPAFDHDDEENPSFWTPLHVWRALGQLRAEAAIGPLIAYLARFGDHDGPVDEIPDVLGRIGPSALAPLTEALAAAVRDANLDLTDAYSRGMYEVAVEFPDSRDAVVAVLAAQLASFAAQDEAVNASLVGRLVNLQAVEHAATIEAAFAARRVDAYLVGDWEEVQVELGLRKARVRAIRTEEDDDFDVDDDFDMDDIDPLSYDPPPPAHAPAGGKSKAQAKRKKKEQKKARKANRKKKR